MARRSGNFRFLLLALIIAAGLWGVTHTTSTTEQGFDIQVVFEEIPENLVITGQSADAINIRVLGSRPAVRDVSPSKMEYSVSVSGAKPGPSVFEVDISQLEAQLPRGARIVSRSPAILEVNFEGRGRRSVRVRPDIEGEPPEGFLLAAVEAEPARVWLVGARSDVLRLQEVVTETVDVSGLTETTEREVRLSLGGGHVWMEESGPVTVRVAIEPVPPPVVEDAEAVDGEPEPEEAVQG